MKATSSRAVRQPTAKKKAKAPDRAMAAKALFQN